MSFYPSSLALRETDSVLRLAPPTANVFLPGIDFPLFELWHFICIQMKICFLPLLLPHVNRTLDFLIYCKFPDTDFMRETDIAPVLFPLDVHVCFVKRMKITHLVSNFFSLQISGYSCSFRKFSVKAQPFAFHVNRTSFLPFRPPYLRLN